MNELIVILVSAFLLFVITLWKRKSPSNLREIPALTRLYRTLGLSIEDGTRLHVSLGNGSLLDARGGSALAGLQYLLLSTDVMTSTGLISLLSLIIVITLWLLLQLILVV